MSGRHTTRITVSTKGQVVLPKDIRDAKNWRPGQKLVVEATREGVLLRPEKPFPPSKLEDVFGSLAHHGKRLTDEDIEGRLRAAAKRRHDRD
jgi:AbrB family looped-hinge helix DNA binding protein